MPETTQEDWTEECDLLVAGSGAAGMAAAITAACHGLKVVVAEKAEVLGGTTAWSGGWIWAPGNAPARREGIVEEADAPRRYLEAVLGAQFRAELVEAFLAAAPEMVSFFETRTAVQFSCGTAIPDTYGEAPAAGTGGRSVIARPLHAGALGADLALLRPPMRETSFLGMTIQAGPDLRAFLNATRSPGAALHVARRLGRHLWHLARHRRGMDLRNGNALAARLLLSARAAGVALRPGHALVELLTDAQGAVRGATLAGPKGGGIRLRARRGVVLACGGYPHDPARRAEAYPGQELYTPLAVPSASGDGLRLGEAVGGRQAGDLAAPAAYCPVSHLRWRDGRHGVFPHIIDRGKPGVIAVLADGRRFCNEGLGYHDYVTAMQAALAPGAEAASWLICDRRFLRRYGLGIVRPAPVPTRWWLRSGYLKRGRSIARLARACGIDAAALADTVARFNAGARRGEDPQFHRGSTPYMRLQGDPAVRPNPCVAPIETAPFYAVRVMAGSFGTFAGLRTDGLARVLGADDRPIAGLYAAGTDMASVMGGHYPAGGINLGPALTFGFIAGRHAAAGGPA